MTSFAAVQWFLLLEILPISIAWHLQGIRGKKKTPRINWGQKKNYQIDETVLNEISNKNANFQIEIKLLIVSGFFLFFVFFFCFFFGGGGGG